MADAGTPVRCLLLSDFQTGGLRGLLSNDKSFPAVEAVSGPFGQVMEVLADAGHASWNPSPDCVVVWTQPQGAIRSFARLQQLGAGAPRETLKEALREVAEFAAGIRAVAASGRAKHVFVPLWVQPPDVRGLGILDFTHAAGLGGALLAMNARLVDELRSVPGVFLLDAQRWIASVGKDCFSPQMWYMAKAPFSNAVLAEAVADLKASLAGLTGQSRKLLVLDLDDTLWGGIVGDAGWEQLKLGGHDPIGEAFLDFQREIKALTARGVVLGIASKNEESVAMEAIRNHPEMVLRPGDFAGWRINWQDKAANIASLAAELNLGLQSVVFLDDNPVERERVRQALPEVLVPEWPKDKMSYARSLRQLRCFDNPHISMEDATRTQMYVAERERRTVSEGAVSAEDFLRRLDVRIAVVPLDRANLARAAQLLNKTNQMNLSTRRLSASELWDWACAEGRRMWTLRVADKFGDSGLVGLVSVELSGERREASIVDLILSCRVFGRRAEEAMLHVAIDYARSLGAQSVVADYQETSKNKPTLTFLEGSGMDREGSRFVWRAERGVYPAPELVTLERSSEAVPA